MIKTSHDKETLYLGGKALTVEQVQAKFVGVGLLAKPSVQKVVSALYEATKPKSASDLAQETSLSSKMIARLLRDMTDAGVVAGFTLGGRTLHYALTVYGVDLARAQGLLPQKIEYLP